MKPLAKIVVACVLMSILLWLVDWQHAADVLHRLHWSVLVPVYGLMIFFLVLSTVKWSSALRMHGLVYRFGYLFRVMCTGFFFNSFLPTAVGGDAYRVYRTLPAEGYRSTALSAVLVERLTGFAALLTLGAVGAVLLLETPIAQLYLVVYLAGGVAGLAGLAMLWAGWFAPLARRLGHLKAVDALLHNIGHLARARRGWVEQAIISFVFQGLSIGLVFWLFVLLGHPVDFWQCALITAAAGIASFLPLSIAGIGVMEGSIVAMAVALGIGYDEALLVALLRRFLTLALSLLCGLVFLAESRRDEITAAAARGTL